MYRSPQIISLLLEFAVPAVIAVIIVALLEFWIAFVAVVSIVPPRSFLFAVFVGPEAFYIRGIGEFQLVRR